MRVKRKALVSGATGFVGSHLVRRLVQSGWEVHIVIRENSTLPSAQEFNKVIVHTIDGSIECLVACVGKSKPDVVFHLASLFLAQHETKDIESLIVSNVLLGNQLLEAMKVNQVSHIVNTGTSWQHYNNEDYNPVCLYAATKQAFEAILEYYIQASGFKAITLKLFDTYGPDDSRLKLFNLLNNSAISGEPLNMSPGEQLIDLVHIDDVVDAYLIAAKRLLEDKVSKHEIYAISSSNPITLKELVESYILVIGQKINVNWGARPYRNREVMNTWSSGVCMSDWKPKISLEKGIADALEKNYVNINHISCG